MVATACAKRPRGAVAGSLHRGGAGRGEKQGFVLGVIALECPLAFGGGIEGAGPWAGKEGPAATGPVDWDFGTMRFSYRTTTVAPRIDLSQCVTRKAPTGAGASLS